MKTLILSLVFFSSYAQADLPHWTEKAVYDDSENTYFVGMALNEKDEAVARKKSLELVQAELLTFLGIDSITGIPLQTKMIHTEHSKNGVSVYRLTFVPTAVLEVVWGNWVKQHGIAQKATVVTP